MSISSPMSRMEREAELKSEIEQLKTDKARLLAIAERISRIRAGKSGGAWLDAVFDIKADALQLIAELEAKG